jgi:hypothetical protein
MTEIRKRIKDSQRQEARGAALHGGLVQSGSGSQVGKKGDVRVLRDPDGLWPEGVLIEYKRTDGLGIRLTTTMLEKIRKEALTEGRRHFLGLEIGRRHYVLLPEEDYVELRGKADDNGDELRGR